MIYVQNEVMHVYQINTFVLTLVDLWYEELLMCYHQFNRLMQNTIIIKKSANRRSSDSSLSSLGVFKQTQISYEVGLPTTQNECFK
jgi:hypothetical protein